MLVGVVGMNTKSSELSLREALSKAATKLFGEGVSDGFGLSAFCVSTCHRIEIYFSSHDLAAAHSEILALLRTEMPTDFEQKLYAYFGEECFAHLADVVAGLDSVIVGESEIQRQAKCAYENAKSCQNLPSALHFLFQKSFKIAKEIRSSPSFPQGRLNLETAIFHLYNQCGCRGPVLFIGNSAINRKILNHFMRKGAQDLTLCTRAVKSAEELFKEKEISIRGWEMLNDWHNFSLVICGTNQPDFLITPALIPEETKLRTRILVDLGVPRTVHPQIGRHPQITLLNIEDVGALLQKKEGEYSAEIQNCKARVRRQIERQLAIYARKETTTSHICHA